MSRRHGCNKGSYGPIPTTRPGLPREDAWTRITSLNYVILEANLDIAERDVDSCTARSIVLTMPRATPLHCPISRRRDIGGFLNTSDAQTLPHLSCSCRHGQRVKESIPVTWRICTQRQEHKPTRQNFQMRPLLESGSRPDSAREEATKASAWQAWGSWHKKYQALAARPTNTRT